VAEADDFLEGLAGLVGLEASEGSEGLAEGFGAASAHPPVTTAAPTQATKGRAHRIEARMLGTYLKVSAIDSQVGAW
jgi:hypothetical protein